MHPDPINIRLERFTPAAWSIYESAVMAIENACYEPSRRECREYFAKIVAHPRSVSSYCLVEDQMAGFSFAAPLEIFPDVPGAREDPEWGNASVLYSADITVAPAFRNRGIGGMLKRKQISIAGSEGYYIIAGRNRLGMADEMIRINQNLGATAIAVLRNSYKDALEQDSSWYYHIELRSKGEHR